MDIQLAYIPQFETTTGLVIDSVTKKPLSGVKVSDKLGNFDFTNLKGSYKIKVPKIENGNKPTDFPLTFTKSQYTTHTEIPYNSLGDIINPLKIIGLYTIEYSTQIQLLQDQKTSQTELDQYNKQFETPEVLFQKRLDKVKVDLKSKVLSLIYNLAAQYGVSQLRMLEEKYKGKIAEELKQELESIVTCPSKADVDAIIAVKNKLVKQINTSLNAINTLSNSVKINDGIITGLDTAYNILKFLPVPTAVLGVGIPISVVNNVQDAKDILQKLIGKLKSTNSGITLIAEALTNILNKVLSYLSILDQITQICSPNTTQDQISRELTALTQQQTQQTSPVVTNVNGFEMGVETEPTTNSLKRRRAIARNQQGVVMLQGEWSYSSIDQILIDELVFYIQQNNLKPN
jgi:hypothetical protein